MTIDASDGSIFTYVTGIPNPATVPTTYNFTVKVASDTSSNNYVTKNFSLTVQPEAGTFAISTTSPLPSAVKNVVYPQTIFSTVNSTCTPIGTTCNTNYTWSISSGSIPPGMTFSTGSFCPSGDHTYIYGTPTTAGTYTFTVNVTDTCSETASKQFTLTVLPSAPTVRSTGNLNVRVCAGDYSVNCGNPSAPVLKSGIVDQFWDQARFGVMDFSKQASSAVTTIEKCSDADPVQGSTPDPDFLTAIENAVPIDPTTTLVNAEYSGINDYYAYATSPGSCDPIDDKPCRQNFVLMITDGEGADNPPTPSGGTPSILPLPATSGCLASANKNLTKNSCFGASVDVRSSTFGVSDKDGTQLVDTYVVNTMGTARSSGYKPTITPAMTPVTTGDILDQAAAKGGGKYYEVIDPTTLKAALMQAFQDIIKRAAAGTAASVLASGEGSGANLIQAVFYPRREFYNMSTGSYDEIAWVGRLTNFWYYVDPFFNSSYIREDDGDKILNLQTPAYSNPVLPGDYIVQMYFDQSSETTMAHRWTDTDGNAAPDTEFPTDIKFEGLGNLWEAGLELWKRNITTDPRTIYTTTDGSTLLPFTKANKTTLMPYLQAASDDEAEAIIRYVNGQDKPTTDGGTTYDYRSRTVSVNLCSTANVLCESDSDCPADSGGNPGTCSPQGTNTWKLGDVLNSTPKISSSIALNAYDSVYGDTSYAAYLATGSTTTADYKDRGMVFAGANDGLLHAFYLGKFSQLSSRPQVAQLTDPNNIGYGKEMWAYIPKNALPYLTYLTDPNYGTCHIYSVDLTPVVFDASIGTAGCSEANYWNCPKYNSDGTANTAAWRTILIAGMRFGGACKAMDSTCSADHPNGVCAPAAVSGTSVGYSSYFALDVTDQDNPQLLWEFSGADLTGSNADKLGFTTSGPAIVRVNARTGSSLTSDKTKDGRWFVVFGSGPTGSIDTTYMQFLGNSDQNMKLYVFDLKQGPSAGITTFDTSTTIGANAFAGSLLNASHDSDTDYQDDVVYVPYVRQCGSLDSSGNCTDTTKLTNGGVLRLRIKDASTVSSENDTALYPGNWRLSSLMDDAGPISSSVVRLQNTNGELWTFFGSGRYYYEQGSTVDDPSNRRRIFGVKDPCFTSAGWKASCTSSDTVGSSCGTTSLSSLLDVTDNPNATSADVTGSGHNGWCIWLDPEVNPDPGATGCTGGQWGYNESNSNPPVYVCRDYKAEREITDPLSTTSGLVFFTTYKPYSDECSLGGKSFIWSVKYNSGGAPGAMLKGVALLQVSTGSIEQLNMSSAFTQAGGRKSTQLEGVPPTAQGLSIMVGPAPVKRVINMRER
jgi:type IV pilus assembly protein PilY1